MAAKKDVKEDLLSQNGSEPTEDEIRKRAYEIHLARSGGPGNEIDDWLKAEAELKEARRVF
ncbi:MAG: DUF2934 domain-containing protein [Candidatus Sulfotelmatobacter sp.]|jgi:hypothetical protein